MTIENRYSKKESLNRIYRLLSSIADVSTPAPGTVPPINYSEDESISLIANLLAGTLSGETASLPSSVSVSSDLVSGATLTTPGTVKLPEFGAIYTYTGTVTVEIGTSYTKITGSFGNGKGLCSDGVIPEYTESRITINSPGTYFVNTNLSMEGASGTSYNFAMYLDNVRQNALTSRVEINFNGDEESTGMSGFIEVTGSSNLELYAFASQAASNCRLIASGVSIFRLET